VLGSKDYTIPPFALVQDPVRNFVGSDFAHAAARATAAGSVSGQILGYVIVADNATNDTAYSPMEVYSPPTGTSSLQIDLYRYRFSPGGPDAPPIVLSAGKTYELTFHAVEGTHGISAIPQLGIEGTSDIGPGADYVVTVTPGLDQRGARYNFTCTHFCGTGHGGMYGAITIV